MRHPDAGGHTTAYSLILQCIEVVYQMGIWTVKSNRISHGSHINVILILTARAKSNQIGCWLDKMYWELKLKMGYIQSLLVQSCLNTEGIIDLQ
jgi:hypothetical protein